MNIAVLTFEGFNELDSFIAAGILNRMKHKGWKVQITCPSPQVTSMNGVTIKAQQPLEFANTADVVLFGSGIYTRDIANDDGILSRLNLNPQKQLLGAQCSGTLLLAKLGYLNNVPACTDLTSKPWVIDAGVEVLNQPFIAKDKVATAGGCMSSEYLATWVIAKLEGESEACEAIRYVAPVGQKDEAVARAIAAVMPYIDQR